MQSMEQENCCPAVLNTSCNEDYRREGEVERKTGKEKETGEGGERRRRNGCGELLPNYNSKALAIQNCEAHLCSWRSL